MTASWPIMIAGPYATAWFAGSAVVFLITCIATVGSFTRRRRNLLRASVFALLMTPVGFGIHSGFFFYIPVPRC